MGAGFECAERLGRRGALCMVEAQRRCLAGQHAAACNNVCSAVGCCPVAAAAGCAKGMTGMRCNG